MIPTIVVEKRVTEEMTVTFKRKGITGNHPQPQFLLRETADKVGDTNAETLHLSLLRREGKEDVHRTHPLLRIGKVRRSITADIIVVLRQVKKENHLRVIEEEEIHVRVDPGIKLISVHVARSELIGITGTTHLTNLRRVSQLRERTKLTRAARRG